MNEFTLPLEARQEISQNISKFMAGMNQEISNWLPQHVLVHPEWYGTLTPEEAGVLAGMNAYICIHTIQCEIMRGVMLPAIHMAFTPETAQFFALQLVMLFDQCRIPDIMSGEVPAFPAPEAMTLAEVGDMYRELIDDINAKQKKQEETFQFQGDEDKTTSFVYRQGRQAGYKGVGNSEPNSSFPAQYASAWRQGWADGALDRERADKATQN